MDWNFIMIQLIGVLGWIFLFISFYRKNTDKILIFQVIASILYCFHYYFLHAYSGLLMCAISVIFDYAYYKTDKDDYLYILSIPLRIFIGMLYYRSIIDILPIVASLIDGYVLTKERKTVVVGGIIYYSLWTIYNFFVMSYSGAVTDLVLVVSNLLIILLDFNIFDRLRKNKIKT